MERKNGVEITRIVTVLTGDIDFINDYASDIAPYQIYVDLELASEKEEIAEFLQGYQKEYELLKNGDIDYIVIEYDM